MYFKFFCLLNVVNFVNFLIFGLLVCLIDFYLLTAFLVQSLHVFPELFTVEAGR